MIEKIKEHIQEAQEFQTVKKEELEAFRIKYLSKKGLLNDFFAEFKNVPNDKKKEFGQIINQLKSTAQEKIDAITATIDKKDSKKTKLDDLTRPAETLEIGSRHPISIVKNQIIDIFSNIGFNALRNVFRLCEKAAVTSCFSWFTLCAR